MAAATRTIVESMRSVKNNRFAWAAVSGAALILRKVYRLLPDPRAAKDDLVRIVDEGREDDFPDKARFVFVGFALAVRKKSRPVNYSLTNSARLYL